MASVGSVLMATDGAVVGTSGKPIRVFSIAVLSGGTAGEVKLYNGTSTSGDLYIHEICPVVSTSNQFNYGSAGILFPAGCFYDEVVDANVTSTLVTFELEP